MNMNWKSVLFEDDKPIPSVYVPPLTPPPLYQPGTPNPITTVSIDGQIYQGLAARTSFDSCPNVNKLLTLAGQLEQFIPDKATRLKAAAKQAQGLGLDLNAISAELTGLFRNLETEKTSATTQMNLAGNGYEQDIARLTNELAERQAKLDAVRNNKTSLNQKRADFDTAYARRKQEIQQLDDQLSEIK